MLGTPTRDRKAERRAAVRREILDAAWEIARESGLTQLTLRDVASRIGMQAPSLYTHFDSKMAIYDAMYGEAWSEYEESLARLEADLPEHPRVAVHRASRHFYDYAIADQPRHQLMNERIIPGFEPSEASYAPAVRVLEPGHVLRAYQTGQTVRDTQRGLVGKKVRLPDEPAGTMMVFRTSERLSYALIMEATTPLALLDTVRNP